MNTFPKPHRKRVDTKSLRTLDPARYLPQPPTGPLTVISVTGLEDGYYRLTFDGPVSCNGGDVSAIEIGYADADEWFSEDASQAGASAIDVLIGSNGFTDWRILTQPPGITQALAVPMSGIVQS